MAVEGQTKEQKERSAVVKRARQSQWPAIPMDEALKAIETLARKFQPESKCFPVAALQPGRVLAEQIFAPEDVPRTRTSIKDGYAVIASDGAGKREVIGFSTAGGPSNQTLKPGQCIRVSTGGVIPAGADAVVQVEDTELLKDDGENELVIKILKAPSVSQDIREKGSDVKLGSLLLDVGCEMGSAEIGLLNAFGIQHVEIYRKPRVCVLSTGNELVEPYMPQVPLGHIRDSNRSQLLALFRGQNFKAIDAGIALDKVETLEYAISVASQFASVIVTSGGVSMGEKDHLKEVLQDRLNLKIQFGRVWMKPGLPCTVAHGSIADREVVVFALPGNPVSSWVCAHLFVSPLLRFSAGLSRLHATKIRVKAAEEIKLSPRPEYCRAWIDMEKGGDLPVATLTGNQISSRLMSLVGAQVLLILPQKGQISDGSKIKEKIEAGEILDAIVVGPI
ncbi:unnamed protein product [Caenorhabditis auriculariae]|uniref:MoaB/Mog domain-containing protein n=1 Tax=Caenorhabditis auriculariae TaxID=2777116 RepID=A0A8S1HND0_9PELO|nr:unnamed protein product [Caenorhabditis auriculariae]